MAVMSLALGACSLAKSSEKPDGLALEIVAGGGTDAVAKTAADAKLTGYMRDLEVGRDGVVRLLTSENNRASIWVFQPGGAARRIQVDPSITTATQLAVADDGTMYVSHPVKRAGLVSKVDAAGKTTLIVGNGSLGFTADGGVATGPASRITGISVDRQGRLVYGELRFFDTANQNIGLVRRVEANGRVTTIAGRSVTLPEDDYSIGIVRSVNPPAGTMALDWSLPGMFQLRSLTTGDDGTIYFESDRGVLAVVPDGTIRAAARRRDRSSALVADRPFTREGDAADADPMFQEDAGITEDAGYVTLPVQYGRVDSPHSVPPAYRWTGQFSAGAQRIVDAAAKGAEGDELQNLLRIVRPDGSLTTAAWAVEGGAIRAGKLYVVISSGYRGEAVIGRFDLPK
ncbi:hypothetical protein GCM10009804_68080 [Kribbella hippodromi]|uniref:Uncharacterized protein n=2 Tax=Kribbella hippodromi TaxID=434347 RepID=A0ABP4Q9L4_9ACTN